MFIENLHTPHIQSSEFAQGERVQPLVSALSLDEIRADIARTSDKNQANLAGAQHIQSIVHKTLRFRSGAFPAVQTQHGDIQNTLLIEQYTNCFGYTSVTSEALSLAGIKNQIIYFKGHFMNGIITAGVDNPQLHMFDVINPDLSQNMTNALRGTSVTQLLAEQQAHKRGAARIDTEQLLGNVGHLADDFTNHKDTINYDWLYFQKGKTQRIGANHTRFARDEQWARRNRYTAFMSIYQAEIGRQILPAYATFCGATERGKLPTIDASLQSTFTLAGLFPELDARLEHDKIKLLVGALTQQDRHVDALAAIFNYCTSFGCSDDPRLKGIEAGLYYDVATTSGDAEIAALGLHAYAQAVGDYTRKPRKQPVFRSETFTGKMKKLQQIINQKAA